MQEQLFEELLDKDSQQQLESAPPALNWSLEVTVRLGIDIICHLIAKYHLNICEIIIS